MALDQQLKFRTKWAYEALTRGNIGSWAHAGTPTPTHPCSSEQIKQAHVPTSCGTPGDPSSTEYLYVTVWEDVASIQAFAGERWQEAVITPDEEHLLKDTWIGHYEVLPTPD
jgi:hypothetical protein